MNTTDNNVLISEFMDVPKFRFGSIIKYATNKEEKQGFEYPESLDFADELNYNTSWNELMPVIDKIHAPMRVKLYGAYRDIEGEEKSVIIHRATQNNRYITLKIEYGRRFVEFTEYQKENETMLEPTYRFVIKFIKWYNKHK